MGVKRFGPSKPRAGLFLRLGLRNLLNACYDEHSQRQSWGKSAFTEGWNEHFRAEYCVLLGFSISALL